MQTDAILRCDDDELMDNRISTHMYIYILVILYTQSFLFDPYTRIYIYSLEDPTKSICFLCITYTKWERDTAQHREYNELFIEQFVLVFYPMLLASNIREYLRNNKIKKGQFDLYDTNGFIIHNICKQLCNCTKGFLLSLAPARICVYKAHDIICFALRTISVFWPCAAHVIEHCFFMRATTKCARVIL